MRAAATNTAKACPNAGGRRVPCTYSKATGKDLTVMGSGFSRLASEISPVPIPTYDDRYLLAGEDAVRYFQDLDHAIEAQLLESFPDDPALRATLNYLYTTLLIEERADVFYPILKAVLAERTGSSTVSRILREEQGHKATVASAIGRLDSQSATRTSALRATEQTLFDRLLTALDRAITR